MRDVPVQCPLYLDDPSPVEGPIEGSIRGCYGSRREGPIGLTDHGYAQMCTTVCVCLCVCLCVCSMNKHSPVLTVTLQRRLMEHLNRTSFKGLLWHSN